jgi:molybdopterin converting factor small subunit
MQLRFYANMRTIIGIPSLDVDDLRVDTFRKLVNLLIERFPEAKTHLLDSHDNLRQDIPVYVDGRNPRLLPMGIDSPLTSDSVVSFFSPISSGRMNVEVLREPNFRNHSAQDGPPAAVLGGESRTTRSDE